MTDAGIIIGFMAFCFCLVSQVSFSFYRYFKKDVICPIDVVVNRMNKHGCLVCAKEHEDCRCPDKGKQ